MTMPGVRVTTAGAWCLLVVTGAGGVAAQDPTLAPPTACAAEEYRQFDFWLGEWEVHDPDGQFQGTNRIEKIQGGCVLQEHWTGASGGTGTSFNIYDFTRDRWHQTWVSGSMLLLLDGGWRDGKMILEGTTAGRDGDVVHNRITWTPVSADVVTQVWETSTDGDAWNVVFNGRYTRKR